MNESSNGENPLFTCLTGSDCTFIPIPIVHLTSLAPVNFTCVELDGVLSSVAYSRRLDTWCGDSLLVCGTARVPTLKSEDFPVQVKQLHWSTARQCAVDGSVNRQMQGAALQAYNCCPLGVGSLRHSTRRPSSWWQAVVSDLEVVRGLSRSVPVHLVEHFCLCCLFSLPHKTSLLAAFASRIHEGFITHTTRL